MTSLFRKVRWWLQRRRKEEELREELRFHLEEEMEERRAGGLPDDEATWAARRDLGNATLVREEARTLWSWLLLEQLAQDVRYGLRGMFANRLFTGLAALSLALGIGANTAIYSFMDAILLRSLPVADPASLIVLEWHSRPVNFGKNDPFVMHGMDGRTDRDPSGGMVAAIFPLPAFERLREVSSPVLSSIFAHKPAGSVNVIVKGEAELLQGHYVSGDFFSGLAVVPAAGRPLQGDDDRAGVAPVAVLSAGYSQRRFGAAEHAIGQAILVNGVTFTVVGVAPPEFFGVDPGSAPQIYLPLRTSLLLQPDAEPAYFDQTYYSIEMMGRLKPGVDLARAQAVLAGPFTQWVASTATNDGERANLPKLRVEEGAAGLDSLRRQYSKPLYVLLAMVGLILAIACANTANLLLARSATRAREIAVRLSLGAGRWRVVRQLLTESVLLATLSGALGILIAVAGMAALTQWLANGEESFTLHAELNWHVLLVTLALSLVCGVLYGLAPALQATRPALMPRLRDRSVGKSGARLRGARPSLTQVLVVAQIATSLLLLVGAGLFVRTLANLQSVSLGFNRDKVLLFELNAPQAGLLETRVADFYADLRRRLSDVPGVRDVTLSHASLIRAGRSHPVTVDGQRTRGTRILWTGPRFFTTMQIPILRGREITERDRLATLPVVVVSELFARTNFGDVDPIGRRIAIGGSLRVSGEPVVFEVVGVAASARYGGLKDDVPPVVYVAYAQVPPAELQQMTYAMRTEGDPMRYAGTVRQIVHGADGRVPITNLKTQAADIDQTINQEIVFARLCSAFAILALTIACVGLYATMAYAVARRTGEIGVRLALGAGRGTVIWMILRDVCVLAAIGLAIGVSAALAASRLIESFLFQTTPNDPRAVALAAAVLLISALAAGYGPARRASRVDPLTALRHE
jgi:macrolide transport system ATP-binding/permease protein